MEKSPQFVPADRPVQLILDALDFPDSLLETAKSAVPTHGIQLFGGASVLGDADMAALFYQAVDKIGQRIS